MTNKQGQISRADLLKAIISGDNFDQHFIAEYLGVRINPSFVVSPSVEILMRHWSGRKIDARIPKKPEGSQTTTYNNPSPTAQLTSTYWQLLKQVNREDEKKPEKKKQSVTQRPVWNNKPERADFPALMSEKAIQQRLLPKLRQEKTTQNLDIEKLIYQVSRAEFITSLPMQRRNRDTQAVQIIDDRQVHLMPYWLDHSWLTWHLQASMPEYRLTRAVIEQGDSEPQSIQDNGLEAYQLPPEGSTVLILSDLGLLTGRTQYYEALLQRLSSQGYHIVVVTPCHEADYPASLKSLISVVSWEENGGRLPAENVLQARSEKATSDNADEAPNHEPDGENTPRCPREQWGETLLSLCAVTVRLEPELLRAVRYVLNNHLRKEGKDTLPAAAESFAWQHPAVSQAHSVAATIDTAANQEWQKVLAHQPLALKRDLFTALRQWRSGLPDEIWFEEFLSVDLCCDEQEQSDIDWFKQDLAEAEAFFNYVHEQALTSGKLTAKQQSQYAAWIHRVALRASKGVADEGQLKEVFQRCLYLSRDADGKIPGGHELDPALVAENEPQQQPQSAWLCQRGNQICVTLHDAFNVPKNRSSMIARLDYRSPKLKVMLEDETVTVDLPTRLTKEWVAFNLEGVAAQKTHLQTDLSDLYLDGFERPKWAKRIGRDTYGLFAELEINNPKGQALSQCFRWVPAGSFMMGSPESEPERYAEDEDYHQVTHTKGFWVADTTVTQAIWEAVMGKNPAKFKEDLNNPVEQVSWDDSQEFIEKLNQALPEMSANQQLRLPSEAEWEYACRAGTETPFSFGDNMTSEQVNFDGSRPYNNAEKSKKRNKTIAVKSLPANPWGLHEMHGNVWEWCSDAWQESLGTEAMVDPCHSVDDSALRVRRGGSWIIDGGYVRSAYRVHDLPDNRNSGIGLRLSLGPELKARSAKKK